MTVWATIFVAGRLYVNYKKLVLADYLAFAAFVFDVGYAALMILSRHMFRHMWDIPVINFANSMIAPVAICLSKTTILAMLYQIFRIRKEMRIAIWIGIIANILVYFPNLIIAPILGAPRIGETWDDLVVNQRPADQKWIGTYQGPFAVLLDVYIFVLPFPALNTLHMPSKKRLKLFILFGTALL
ncbi:hypothetical protein UCDDA912_g09729 [Diaporthe ampelina]|uniref:Rhodopsin domain-containing protein n=1 Tax=Diaporthe ampelina TaxID=1214573 RepID=A0A0G2H540_9PEZI|nr:hypothetical protein UCDDA912_g09729 [Diaporthe ampelina]